MFRPNHSCMEWTSDCSCIKAWNPNCIRVTFSGFSLVFLVCGSEFPFRTCSQLRGRKQTLHFSFPVRPPQRWPARVLVPAQPPVPGEPHPLRHGTHRRPHALAPGQAAEGGTARAQAEEGQWLRGQVEERLQRPRRGDQHVWHPWNGVVHHHRFRRAANEHGKESSDCT